MKTLSNQHSFALNEKGHLTPSQTRQLSLWLARYCVVFGLVGVAFFAIGERLFEYAIVGGATLVAVSAIWRYGMDLLKAEPIPYSGIIRKEIRRFRGPTRYEIVMSNGLRARAFSKAQWQMLAEDQDYNLFYTKHTKWLLSWKNRRMQGVAELRLDPGTENH